MRVAGPGAAGSSAAGSSAAGPSGSGAGSASANAGGLNSAGAGSASANAGGLNSAGAGSAGPAWSGEASAASWIADRLAPFDAHLVSSVVPAGFGAYARILHPADEPDLGEHSRLVRWHEVASWSGVPLAPLSQFHSIAMPPERPSAPPPWTGQGPRAGTLYREDATALSAILRRHTSTPERCWFCVWDGYGWESAQMFLSAEDQPPPARLPDPVPAGVRRGERVRLPNRDYLLYTGPIEAVLATSDLAPRDQTANLWWPDDREFCVASEIDLCWTYVGGSEALVSDVLSDTRLEAVAASPDDTLTYVEPWLESLVEQAADELLARGESAITTSLGTLRAVLERPSRLRTGLLRTSFETHWGHSGSSTPLRTRDEGTLRKTLVFQLTAAVLSGL